MGGHYNTVKSEDRSGLNYFLYYIALFAAVRENASIVVTKAEKMVLKHTTGAIVTLCHEQFQNLLPYLALSRRSLDSKPVAFLFDEA